jgi:ankyrin repeat protein
MSALRGYLEATKTFAAGGAPLNSTDINGKTPMDLALENDKLEVYRYLEENATT